MATILGIGIGATVLAYNTVLLVYAMRNRRNRWLDERLRQYGR